MGGGVPAGGGGQPLRLRLRLALTTVAVAVPVVAGLAGLHLLQRRTLQEQVLEAFALAQMQAGGRERCEATPETWVGTGLPPRPLHLEPRGGPALGGPPPFGPPGGLPPLPPPGGPGGPGGPPPLPGWRGPGPRMEGPPPGRDPPRPPELFAYGAQLVSLNPQAPALVEEVREALFAGRSSVSRRVEVEGQLLLEVVVRMPWETGPCAYVLARRLEPPELWLPPLELWLLPTLIVLGAVLLALGPVVRRIRRLTTQVRASAGSGYEQAVRVEGKDEVAELARAFQEAREEIRTQIARQEARERALRDFLANTTHDVMTPLTVLLGHLSGMQQRLGRGEGVEGEQVAQAVNEAHYMSSLVHNLAVAARLEAGAPQVQRAPVDLNALVARVVARHLPFARQQQVELVSGVPEAPTWVEGDVTLLEQAVSNVVFNGLRYGRAGGHVAVVLESTREGRFRLRVLDDGPGIPEPERARLLERGARGNQARTRAPNGQGLGLDIVHQVARLHGWTLALGASEYGGLEVTFGGEGATSAPAA